MASDTQKKADVLEIVKKLLKSLEIPGDEGRQMFLSTIAPRGLAIHARKPMQGRPNASDIQYEDFPEGFADRIPWNGEKKMVEGLNGEPTVLIDHDIAMVWTPYYFTVDGQLSHVGTNICSLLCRNWYGNGPEHWLVVSVTDTARSPSDEDSRKHEARS